MKSPSFLLVVLLSALITVSLRALPFLLFGGNRKMPEWLTRLGRSLPPAIMAVLIIYCLRGAMSNPQNAAPAAVAVLIVVGSYAWKHQTFLSIFLGTAAYMAMLRILF